LPGHGPGSQPAARRPDTWTAKSAFFLMVAQLSALASPH